MRMPTIRGTTTLTRLGWVMTYTPITARMMPMMMWEEAYRLPSRWSRKMMKSTMPHTSSTAPMAVQMMLADRLGHTSSTRPRAA